MNNKERKKSFFQPIIIILLIIVFIKILFIISKNHTLFWDEAVYLSMGKWLYSNGTIGLWEIIRPLGFPLILGLFWKLNFNYLISADIVILLFTIGTIYLTYLISKIIFNKQIALLSSILLFLTPIFFYNSFTIMTSIPSLFFILLSLYFYITKKYIYSGIFSSIAFTIRFPSAIIFIAINLIWLYEQIKSKKFNLNIKKIKPIIKYNISFIIIISSYLIINKISYGSFIEPLLLAGDHQSVAIRNIKGIFSNILYYPYTLLITNIFFIFFIFQKKIKNKKLYLILIPLITIFSYFTYIPHKQPRFAILFLPFLSILASIGFYNFINYFKQKKIKTILSIIIICIFLSHPIIIDYKLFKEFPNQKLDIVTEYYEFFNNADINDSILTTEPHHAFYTNKKYIQFYNNITDANNIYDKNIKLANAIIYTPASFPCLNNQCNISKQLLEQKIKNDCILIYNQSWWGNLKQIYIKKE
jgi:4-amino-4-deoxy-L-arabinose transferase-like glycosyltransferase